MAERGHKDAPPPPWQVPIARDDVAGDTGEHVELVADAGVRAAIAGLVGLRELPRLEAAFDVTRRGAGLHVAGTVSATVGQTCVVTLEPLVNEVEETVDLLFLPQIEPVEVAPPDEEEGKAERREAKLDAPEPLIDGRIDLGAIATEFLMLGIDPYPRKAGAVFEAPAESEADAGPFAALAKLTKG